MALRDKPQLLRRSINVLLMGLGWCLALSGVLINISVTTIASTSWKGVAWATLPVGMQTLCSAFTVVPAGRLAVRYGRRVVFVCAALLGVVGGCIMVAAAWHQIYGLLVFGAFLQGPSFGVANGFRFVSAEFMTGPGYTPEWRARAISVTVGFAAFAALIGPEAVQHVRDSLAQPYAGAYVLLTCIYAAQAVILASASYGWLAEQQRLLASSPSGPPPGPGLGKTDDKSHAGAKETGLVAVVGSASSAAVSQSASEADQVVDLEQPTGPSPAAGPVAEADQQLPPVTQAAQLPPPTSPAGAPPGPAAPSGVPSAAGGAAPAGPPLEKGWVMRALLRPDFLMPAVGGAFAFANMAGLMVNTPVAMQQFGHTFSQSTYTIEGHIVAMFVPGALVGEMLALIRALAPALPWVARHLLLVLPFPPPRASPKTVCTSPYPDVGPQTAVMVWGAAFLVASNVVCLSGTTFGLFMAGLVLLGAGWALVYVAASSLVTAIFVREPHLRVAVQGGMDTLVVFMSACANILSGPFLRAMGWTGFLYLNIAFNIFLLLWCTAYHVLAGYRWCRVAQGPASSAPAQ